MSKYSEVKAIISHNFPKSKIKSLKEFPEGYNNVAYDVELNSGNYVIKILKIKGIEDYVLKQKKIRTLLLKKYKKFPIGRVIKFDSKKKIISRPYIITEKLPGQSLKKTYDKIKNKDEFFEELGELYGKLHSFEFKSLGELDSKLNLIKKYKSWYAKTCGEVERIFEKIEDKKLLSQKNLKLNEDFFNKNKKILREEQGKRLCHGDASFTNILVDGKNGNYHVSGIIDFEFSRSGGVTKELFSEIRKPHLKYLNKVSILRGYNEYNELPKNWEKLRLMYLWISSLNRIDKIDGMKWRNLSKSKALSLKKDLRKEALSILKDIRKKF